MSKNSGIPLNGIGLMARHRSSLNLPISSGEETVMVVREKIRATQSTLHDSGNI